MFYTKSCFELKHKTYVFSFFFGADERGLWIFLPVHVVAIVAATVVAWPVVVVWISVCR